MNVLCDCSLKHQNGGVCNCLDNDSWEEDYEDNDVETQEEDVYEPPKKEKGRFTNDLDDFLH